MVIAAGDEHHDVVASIVDEAPSAGEDQPIVASIDENGQKVAYLPNGGDYRVEVVAREDCDVSCGVEEVSAETGEPVRVTNFETAELQSGEAMSAEVPAVPEGEMGDVPDGGSSASYTMTRDGSDVGVESDIRGAEAIAQRTFNVTASFDEEQGQVFGGGSFVEGSFARLEAMSGEGYIFDGFYVDGARYEGAEGEEANVARFKVTKDMDVEARFVEKTAVSVPTAASGLVYSGGAQVGVAEGEGYSVEGGAATKAGSYTAKVTLDECYKWADGTCRDLEVSWAIAPAAVTSIALSKVSYTYSGKAQKPGIGSVKAGSLVLKPSDYTVEYSNTSSTAAGTYTVTVMGKGNFVGSKAATYEIAQAANSAAVAKTAVKKALKAKSLKKRAKTLALPKVTTSFGKAKWTVAKKDSKKVLTLNSGKVRVKKGATKGKYTIKLKATVAGTSNYAAATTKVVTVKVTVK